MIKKNINSWERVLRFSIACLVLAYALWASSWIALAIAAFIFFEAFAGWCIVYQLLGKNNCPLN